MNYVFLPINAVLAIHIDQIQHHGGDPNVRDMGLLSSAVNMPQQMFGGNYVHESIFSMAAAYLFHIVNNHPFVDGNKRTGVTTALQFLRLNGIRCTAASDEFYALVISVATGECTKEDITTFFEENHKRV